MSVWCQQVTSASAAELSKDCVKNHGLYKAELIHRRGPWKTKEAVELATLGGCPGSTITACWSSSGTSPDEAEVNYYRQLADPALPA